MLRKQNLLQILMFALWTLPIWAEEPLNLDSPSADTPTVTQVKADGMSISEMMEIVRTGNLLLKAGRESIEAAKGRRQQSGLRPNPEFEFESEEMPSDNFGDFSKSANTFLFKQEILTAGKRKAAMAAAGKEVEISTYEYALLEREIFTEGKTAFYALLMAQEKVTVSNRLVEIAQKNAQASQRRVDVGDVSSVDAVRANIALSRTRVELEVAEKVKANAAKELLRLMGTPDAALSSVGQAGELYQTADVFDGEGALAAVLEKHPQLQGIVRTKELAELEQKVAEKERWPNVEAGIGVKNAPDAGGGREQTFTLVLGIPLPIFNRNQGAIAEAQATRRKAEYELQAGRQELTTRFRLVLRNYNSARQQVERFAKEIVPGAREAFDLINRAYEAGDISQLELLDAQQTLTESELEYVESLGALKAAKAELEGLIGNEDLLTPNSKPE
ncbi:MAG: TolC family protein [Planctomycetota bacterium]|nr:TolC family protein [Planctomycetota bacterium]MDA1140160.1 TolC family protein [Planctomycetota bacterium]